MSALGLPLSIDVGRPARQAVAVGAEVTVRVHASIVMVILLAVGVASFTQGKPNFSGEWVLNKEASQLSPGADGMRGAVWRIDHLEPRFVHKASFVTESKPIEWQYDLQSDGREVTATHPGGTTTSRLSWDGQALVVTMRTQRSDGGAMTISFRYELVDGGRRLRAFEQLRGTDHDQDNVWVFDRR